MEILDIYIVFNPADNGIEGQSSGPGHAILNKHFAVHRPVLTDTAEFDEMISF